MEHTYTVHFHKGKKVKVQADRSFTDMDSTFNLFLQEKRVFLAHTCNIKFITIK